MIKLTVIGNNGPYPAAGGACSGYLLQSDMVKVVMDLGSGALANLFQVIDDPEEIDAIVLSHLHADHMSDLFVLKYALEATRRNTHTDKNGVALRTKLYSPDGPEAEFNMIQSLGQFDLRPICEESEFSVGDLNFTVARMIHGYPTFAISVTDGEHRLVFTGDTVWNQDIIHFAENADLLLMDAAFRESDKLGGTTLTHLTAWECGIIAAQANVTRVLLTHFLPGCDTVSHIREAEKGMRKVFAGNNLDHVAVPQKDRIHQEISVMAAQILETYTV